MPISAKLAAQRLATKLHRAEVQHRYYTFKVWPVGTADQAMIHLLQKVTAAWQPREGAEVWYGR
jgi:hypothetical protein